MNIEIDECNGVSQFEYFIDCFHRTTKVLLNWNEYILTFLFPTFCRSLYLMQSVSKNSCQGKLTLFGQKLKMTTYGKVHFSMRSENMKAVPFLSVR